MCSKKISKLIVHIALIMAVTLFVVSCKESSPEGNTGGNVPNAPQTPGPAIGNGDAVKPANNNVEMVPIEFNLPKAMFIGTPQNINVPNLQKPLGRPRDPFLAPVGTKNFALGKTVTSSDPMPIIGELEMITDGDKEATDGSYVELGPLKQHVTIDLGGEFNIYAVLFWHQHRQASVYYDVVVKLADDADFITNVRTIFNNDIDNSAGEGIGEDMHYVETSEGKLIDAKGEKARYIRLYSGGCTQNELNQYLEVEVYGKPAK
jgi:hypothetical protein